MANSAFRLEVALESDPSPAKPAPLRVERAHPSLALSVAAVGTWLQIKEIELEQELGEWLRAVGICEGERLTVLRRAAFGGPVHVRTRSGGEFALNRSLAHSIAVIVLPHGDPDA